MASKLRAQRRAKRAVHGGDVWDHFPVVDFSSNVNPLGPPKSVLSALKEELWRINYYPDINGKTLKHRIADYLSLSASNIALGNGSTELIKSFCEVFIEDGDSAAIAEPTFSEYAVWCQWAGARVNKVYSGSNKDFDLNIDDLIASSADTIFICNPNNPTGVFLEDITMLLDEAQKNGTIVLLDEAYIEFTDAKSACSLVKEYDNLCVLRSMTKFYSLPGLRIGYAVANEEMISALESVSIPWNINAMAEVAAISALKDKEFVKASKAYIEREKKFLFDGLRKLGVRVYPSSTNFFLFDIRDFKITAAELKKELLKKGMLIRDCSSFDDLDEYYARISVRKHEENIRLLDEMERILSRGREQ